MQHKPFFPEYALQKRLQRFGHLPELREDQRLLPLFMYCLTYLPEPGKLAAVILLVSACAEILVRVVAELLEFHQG